MMKPLTLEVKPLAIGEEAGKGYVFTFRYPNTHAYEFKL